jgi:hypothetical protein
MAQLFLRERPGVAERILGHARYNFIKDHKPSTEEHQKMRKILRFCTYEERKEFSQPFRCPMRLVFSEYIDDSSDSDSDSDSDSGSGTTVQEKLFKKTEVELNKMLNDLYSKDPQMYVIFKKQMIGDYVEYSSLDVYHQHQRQWDEKIHEWIKEYNFEHQHLD